MGYCPKCGAEIYLDEVFCVNCGDKLPNNIAERMNPRKWRFKYLLLPLLLLIIIIGSSTVIYTLSERKVTDAKALYLKAEEALLLTDYHLANERVEQALNTYPVFTQAERLQQFTLFTSKTLDLLAETESKQEKLQLILQAKNELTHYTGEAASQFGHLLTRQQTDIQLELLNTKLANDPSINDLPALLWEADSIQDPEAYELVRTIREQLIAHATNKAYDLLEQNQFRVAKDTIENSLLYSPNDDRLTSLLNSIEKEKEAFEVAQEARLEQAFSEYEVEQEINEHNAIDNVSIEMEINQREQLVVSGEITSVATVPIHAILVHYLILDEDGEEIESTEIFVYPETLYPGETGTFERFYLDEAIIETATDVSVTSVTWLLD